MHGRTQQSICFALLMLFSVAGGAANSEPRGARLTTALQGGSDWPSWSGPQRDLTSTSHGLLDGDSFGLELAWTRTLGSGYSVVLATQGRIVATFSDGESDYVVALDASNGAEHWRYRISSTYKGDTNSDDGPLSTPTVDGGVVYGLGTSGALFAVSLADGTERWRRDLVGDLGAVMRGAGFATAPTVLGDLLVVETGGNDGRAISAFERETGTLRWSVGDDSVTYQSPLVLDLEGEPLLVAVTDQNLLGLAPETGEVLWQYRHTEGERGGFGAAQPVPVGEGGIFLNDGRESALFQVRKEAEGFSVEEAWRARVLRSQGNFASPVPHEGHLYGFSGSFLSCVDAATGEEVWRSRPPGRGGLVLVDGHLFVLARSGDVVVAEATPEGYVEKARVNALDRGYFTRPSFAGGFVYVRNLTHLSAVAITADAEPSSRTQVTEADWDLRGDFGRFVRELAASENKTEKLTAFLAEHPTRPILEGTLVHFVYHGEVEDLAITSNFIRDGSQQAMHRVEGTDFYFKSFELPQEAVFTYRYWVFDRPMLDPGNPRTFGPENDRRSLLTTAGWEAPSHLLEPDATSERGRLEVLRWTSESLENAREVQVYLPPGYDDGADYPLLVVIDGEPALSDGQMHVSLDNLIGKTVAPIVVVFVPTVQGGELGGNRVTAYTEALVEELIPLLEESYRIDAHRRSRAVLGQDRYGGAGYTAMYLALLQPETFSKAAAQSYQRGAFLEELFAAASGEKHDLEFVFHWSSHDVLDPYFEFDARGEAQSLATALEENGYAPTVFESNDGFGWGMWQGRMDEILEALFPVR
ncbi:MAG: PQQ-binding-like beta-propeller repeat protein [Acidobacteriota bacterium]